VVYIIYYVWLVTLAGVLTLQVYRLIKGIPTIFTYADLTVSVVGIVGSLLAIMKRDFGRRLLLFVSGSFFGITIVSLTYRFTGKLISPIVYGVSYLLILSIVTAFYVVRRW
jgi:hypothetical protein